MILGFLFLIGFIFYRMVKSVVTMLQKITPDTDEGQWCDQCADFHPITVDDGQVWEMHGHYYVRKEKKIDDVTEFISQFNSHSGETSQDSEGKLNPVANKIAKKGGRIKRR